MKFKAITTNLMLYSVNAAPATPSLTLAIPSVSPVSGFTLHHWSPPESRSAINMKPFFWSFAIPRAVSGWNEASTLASSDQFEESLKASTVDSCMGTPGVTLLSNVTSATVSLTPERSTASKRRSGAVSMD
ncbi:MAG: hypothetical protein BWY82_02164 [Verrucomicrobia bacterium ADurb.Bin474]|nr:MAG: hypothetical protein BWY82_02164 [Verrucomicrobia bacterium ADurb.Bin474]